MKIIGFTYFADTEEPQILLKGDSCLLVNRKPFFAPDGTDDLRAMPCVVLRVSRLGKSVAARFADRYFDAFAYGYDFVAWDILTEKQRLGRPWAEATCFDYSLAVGSWLPVSAMPAEMQEQALKAVEQASRLMTIRQGDLIYIHAHAKAQPVHRDEVLCGPSGAEKTLYCKVK